MPEAQFTGLCLHNQSFKNNYVILLASYLTVIQLKNNSGWIFYFFTVDSSLLST